MDHEAIKSRIFVETVTHVSYYSNFLEPVSKLKLLENLKFYLLFKKYNNRFDDCLPLIIANAFHINIELYDQQCSNNLFIKHCITPNFCRANSTLLLFRCGDHFNAIVPSSPPNVSVNTHIPSLASIQLRPHDITLSRRNVVQQSNPVESSTQDQSF